MFVVVFRKSQYEITAIGEFVSAAQFVTSLVEVDAHTLLFVLFVLFVLVFFLFVFFLFVVMMPRNAVLAVVLAGRKAEVSVVAC